MVVWHKADILDLYLISGHILQSTNKGGLSSFPHVLHIFPWYLFGCNIFLFKICFTDSGHPRTPFWTFPKIPLFWHPETSLIYIVTHPTIKIPYAVASLIFSCELQVIEVSYTTLDRASSSNGVWYWFDWILSGLMIDRVVVLPMLQRLALLSWNAPVGSVLSLNFPLVINVFLQIKTDYPFWSVRGF